MQVLLDPALSSDHFSRVADCSYLSLDDTWRLQPGVRALLVRSGIKVNAQLLDLLPDLSFVGCPISGGDHVDLVELRARGLELSLARGCNAAAVCDYVAHMLAASGQLPALLHGDAQLGLVGYGAVGSLLARRAQALGISVQVYDPLAAVPSTIKAKSIEQLSACAVLSLHCSLHHGPVHSSFKLIGADLLSALRHPQLLINAARGAVLDQSAAHQRAAEPEPPLLIADTWQGEPDCDQGYFDCLWALTPHIAGHSQDAYYNGLCHLSDAFAAHFQLELAPPTALPAPPPALLTAAEPEQLQRSIIEHFPLLPEARRFYNHARRVDRIQFGSARAAFQMRRDLDWIF